MNEQMISDDSNVKSNEASDGDDFHEIWERIIKKSIALMLESADEGFIHRCNLRMDQDSAVRGRLSKEYHRLRKEFKYECYGNSPENHKNLDFRKLAAVLCATLISQKVFIFNVAEAQRYAKDKYKEMNKNQVEFNKWAVRNYYINYRLAYKCSTLYLYTTLLEALTDESTRASLSIDERLSSHHKDYDEHLNKKGYLYPYKSRDAQADDFSVNVIYGLARENAKGEHLNMMLYAMLMYQYEAHTIDCIEKDILFDCNTNK